MDLFGVVVTRTLPEITHQTALEYKLKLAVLRVLVLKLESEQDSWGVTLSLVKYWSDICQILLHKLKPIWQRRFCFRTKTDPQI